MCFNLNILNICLAKKSSSSSKSRGKKTSSSSASSANTNNNNNNNNNTTSLANNSANTTLKVANDEPVEQPSDTTTNNNTSPNHYNSPYPQPPPPPQRLKHPNTLALRTSNNFNQAVSELECENEETLNSLYLANNISYLVDRDRIIDTPGNQAATLEEELVCDSDFYRRLPSSSRFQHHASPDLEDDWDLEQKEDHELNKSKQPLLKYLNNNNTNSSNKSNRFETVYKSISSSQNTASTKSTPLAGSFFGQTGGLAAVQSSLAHITTSNEQQQQQQQTNQVNNSQLNAQYLPSSSSSSSSSTSKSSSFSSLVNTSSNQSPYSSVSTLIQNQQQQQLKFNPVKLFHQTMSNNNNNSPTHSGGGPSAQRPILGIPSRPGFSSPGLIPTPSSTASQLEALKIENLRPKKQAYYFQADNQLLIGRPNELPMLSSHDDDELSSILDEELNNSKSDENSKDSATSGAGKHHHHLSHQQQQQQQQRNQQQLHHASSSGGHHQHHGHHHHHHHHISLNNIKSRGGKITISPQQVYEFKESDFNDLGQIGNGEFGSVHKVLHKPSQTMMAMKRVGPTVGNQGERKKVLKELDFVLECHDYAYVVKFYGVKFNNEPADCLICMELMDTSLEKFYKFVYDVKHEEIPEAILGKVVVAAVNALNYLKEEYQIIHRDVKPSNMLINRRGEIKMCDFGISGKLVDSIAASRDAGCQLYMAPERIDPTKACANGYDVRSDVWSLGITMYELATGKFPYPQWKTIFHQLNLVVDSDAPRIESARLSQDFKDFVNTCLTKDEKKRPKYRQLLQYPLLKFHSTSDVNVAAYVEPYINEMLAMSSSSNNAK